MRTLGTPIEPVSLAEAKLHCRIDSDVDDPLLAIYITSSREWAEAFLGYAVTKSTLELDLPAFPEGDIALGDAPLAVTSITYRDVGGVQQTLAADAYAFDLETAAVRPAAGGAWPAGSAVTVRFDAGFSAAGDDPQVRPLPRSIVAAVLLVVAYRYLHREDATAAAVEQIPMGAAALLTPLKSRLGFA